MKKPMAICSVVVLLMFGSLTNVNAAPTTELITNGDFETGDFTGWTTTDLLPGSGAWFVDTPGSTTPISGYSTLAVGGSGSFGSSYAISDQTGPGTHSLTQTFTVLGAQQSVILSFDMFVNDQDNGPIFGPLDHAAGVPVQFGTVDILTAGASPFDTGAGVLANFYLGVDPRPNPNPFTGYSFDITGLVGAGGTFQVRFAEVDNQLFFNQGVDNVSVLAQPIPAPGAILLGSIGVGFVSWLRRRRTL